MAPLELGLVKVNSADRSSSLKSMTVPSINSSALESTKTHTPAGEERRRLCVLCVLCVVCLCFVCLCVVCVVCVVFVFVCFVFCVCVYVVFVFVFVFVFVCVVCVCVVCCVFP